jgi:hypothetical protein
VISAGFLVMLGRYTRGIFTAFLLFSCKEVHFFLREKVERFVLGTNKAYSRLICP